MLVSVYWIPTLLLCESTHHAGKSPYRQKKILLTALRKKCLPCRENSAYRTKKNLLTGWRKYSLPHDGKFILPCIVTVTKDSACYKESFGEVTFTEAGTYEWTISEAHKGETIDGIEYDGEDKTVTIKVVDDGKGNLVADEDCVVIQTAEFTNNYSAEGEGEIKVQKVLEGRPWKDGEEFTFTISAEDGTPMPPNTSIYIHKDDEDHIRSFGDIEFTEAGKYTYVIKEVKGDAKGIKYDTKAHKVTFEVVDDGDGNLVAKDGTTLIQTVKITNTYKTKGNVDTGDSSRLLMNVAMMLASMLALLVMIIRRRMTRQ